MMDGQGERISAPDGSESQPGARKRRCTGKWWEGESPLQTALNGRLEEKRLNVEGGQG